MASLLDRTPEPGSEEKKEVPVPVVAEPQIFPLNGPTRAWVSAATPGADFKGKSVRGGAAAVAGQIVSMALQIGTTVILARLLSPGDYGLQGMVTTLTASLFLFRDAGLGVAAVQRENMTQEQMSTLFWINVGLGAFLTVLVASISPFLAAFYREPRLLWLTVASASIFLLSSLASQHRVLMDRAMRFTTSVKIDTLCLIIGAIIAIVMAALGCGYWSLICQTISLPLVGAIAFWIAMPWVPGKPRWTPELRSMVRFGGTVTLNSFVVYLAYNAEKILLGRDWGADALGLYGRAYQLANLPVQQLTNGVGTVAFPALSRLQTDPDRLRRAYLKFHSVVVSLTVPVVIGCALFSEEIVTFLLGPKWRGAAVLLRFLAPAVFVFAVMNPLSWLLRATGRVGRSLKIAFLIAPVVILAVVAGLRHGPPGVAMGYSTAMVLLVVPLVAWAKHGTGVSTGDYWDCISRPLLSGVLGAGAGWLFKSALHGSLATIPLLIGGLTISFAVYAVLLLFVLGQKDLYADMLRQIFARNRAVPAEG
jgi:O-antigen/teichoic acid export membrane protein